MAFFCPQTGVRVVAPGVHVSVDPNGVEAFDDSARTRAAESAAVASLAEGRLHVSEVMPSEDAQRAAREAASKALAPAEPKPETKDEPKPATGGRKPKTSEAPTA